MADLADVETAVVAMLAGILFPATPYLSGDYASSVAQAAWPPPTLAAPTPAVAPIVTRLYRGWPVANNLDADLALGRAHVSVFSESGMTRLVPRYFPVDATVSRAPHTLSWSVVGATATLTGTISTPQNIGLVVDQHGWGYAVQPGDTLATAAAALTALIVVDRPATAVGPTIALAGAHSVSGRVGTYGTSQTEVRRVAQGIRVSVWAPTPAARDALCGLIDSGISGLRDAFGNLTEFFALADGSGARITYRTTYVDDKPQETRLWRRDLCYSIEYSVTASSTDPEAIIVIQTQQSSTQDPATFTPTDPPVRSIAV